MSEATTGEAEVLRLRQSIETQMRRRILEAIEFVLEEELTEALGLGRYERGDARRGYRNGHQTRRITTAVGAQTLDVPRGRIVDPDGSSHEFRSEALPRYARRTRVQGRHFFRDKRTASFPHPSGSWSSLFSSAKGGGPLGPNALRPGYAFAWAAAARSSSRSR